MLDPLRRPSPLALSSPPRSAPARDAAIEGLRGLAAFTVFYQHLMVASLGGWSPPAFLSWFTEAAAAVMIFFVLSGYVIGLTTAGIEPSANSVRAYVTRRLQRLGPINTLGVFLACAFATSLDWPTVVANLCFLENYCDYAGYWLPVLDLNPNLWSLNYEALFYALFLPIWILGLPLRWVALGTGAVLLLGWYTRFVPVFAACYAAGFLFWLAGLALARCEPDDTAERCPWPSGLLLALVTWKLQALRLLLSGLPMPGFYGPVVRLYALDFLLVAVWLLAMASRRRLPARHLIVGACGVIPAVGLLANVLHHHGRSRGELLALTGCYAAALALWRWRPTLAVFRRLAPLGALSFALYALSRPIQEFVLRHAQVLPAHPATFALVAAVITAACFGLAWYVELRLLPGLRRPRRIPLK